MVQDLVFNEGFERGKPLIGWIRRGGDTSKWYKSRAGLLIQDGRNRSDGDESTILLVRESMDRPHNCISIEAQIRQLGDAEKGSVGVVFGYLNDKNYLRYEERKDYQDVNNRFRRLVRVIDGKEEELQKDRYESDHIPTHISYRITEDIRIEVLRERTRVWHDNILLWDLVIPDLEPGAAGLFSRGMGILACQKFSIRPISELSEGFFHKIPYLQNPTTSSITIVWETNRISDSRVEYGSDRKLGMSVSGEEGQTIHRVVLKDLEPDTRYFYRASSNGVTSKIESFRTAPALPRPFTFCVIGDTHSRPIASQIAENILKDKPEFVINVGDAASNGRLYEQWRDYFDSMSALYRSVPSFHVVGNHEGTAGDQALGAWFFRYFSHPGYTDHYAFTYANCRFIILDNYELLCEGSQQHGWLVNELESPEYSTADFHLAFFHEPGYCTGWGLQSYDGNPEVRTILMPLFQKHGLDIIFNGHCHDYERGETGGIHTVITGGGGGALDIKCYDVGGFVKYSNEFHHVNVDVDGKLMRITAKSIEGRIIDRFEVISKR